MDRHATSTDPRATSPAALPVVAGLIRRHGLTALAPTLAACESLARADAPLDVAILGQFKSGKSSLLNALVGTPDGADPGLLPVGVLPVTAVVTRLSAADTLGATVSRLDGATFDVPPAAVGEYVSEAGNPDNIKRVAAVDIRTPALAALHGLRLVDTPGLGSVHAHNTRATLDWLPGVALALVAISVERPLSEEDRRLIETLRPLASRVVIVLTKADLLTPAELAQVRAFVAREVRAALGPAPGGGDQPLILPFSVRSDRAGHVAALRDGVLAPAARNAHAERAAALAHKLAHLTRATHDYLRVALASAEKVGQERDGLRAAVLDESVHESVIAKELSLAAESVLARSRERFEDALKSHTGRVESNITASLAEMKQWRGHLGKQSERFRAFLAERLAAELAALDPVAAPIAAALVEESQQRLRRVIDGFRQRLGANIRRVLGVDLTPLTWDPPRVAVTNPAVVVGQTFMTHWDLFWWLLPMPLIGGLFRWHCTRKVPWEVWINTLRAAGGWYVATGEAVDGLNKQALAWTRGQIGTLDAMLSSRSDDTAAIRAALAELEGVMEGGGGGQLRLNLAE